MTGIIITGASSGIGAALALHYAAPGVALGLTGRDEGRITAIATACRARGAIVDIFLCDVTEQARMQEWMLAFDISHPVTLVIANAGISGGVPDMASTESSAQTRLIFAVNFHAAIETAQVLIPNMKARGHGQIALISSVAGFRGWPGAPAYCASKAALRIYGESLRLALRNFGVRVNIVCPGFVTSAMTDQNKFPMPFKISAENAARRIAKGLKRNRRYIVFPFRMRCLLWVMGLIPERFLSSAAQNIRGKETF